MGAFIIILLSILLAVLVLLQKKKDCDSLNNSTKKETVLSTNVPQPRKIKETRCSCSACGNIWYYGKEDLEKNIADQRENKSIKLDNLGTDLMCCGGCWPALFMPKRATKELKDLNKCPKCNSSAVKKEEVVHEV